jgi:hypothetical protein
MMRIGGECLKMKQFHSLIYKSKKGAVTVRIDADAALADGRSCNYAKKCITPFVFRFNVAEFIRIKNQRGVNRACIVNNILV